MLRGLLSIIFVLAFITFITPAFSQSENPLAESETLMTQEKFYEAIMVLKSLLTTNEKSHDQEQALWLANSLCEILVRDRILTREFEETHKIGHSDRRWEEDYMKWEKVVILNNLGADIGFEHLGGVYDYNYGFLKRLVELYPDSKPRASAEYYLIKRRYNEREPVERWLDELHSYANKNADSGTVEIYMAYLDIAHINDSLWQVLTYPDGTYSEPFRSGDSALDKKRAAEYKAEALKYYARVIVSGFGGRFGYPNWFDTKQRFQELKLDKKTTSVYIIYD